MYCFQIALGQRRGVLYPHSRLPAWDLVLAGGVQLRPQKNLDQNDGVCLCSCYEVFL